MRMVRFMGPGRTEAKPGRVEGNVVYELEGSIFGSCETTGSGIKLEDVRLLAPCTPSKVVAVGLNYRDHAEEVGMPLPEEPMIFMKPATAVIGPGDPIVAPAASRRVDYEAELGVVIGRRAVRVKQAEALNYVLGYTALNDVTARDLQAKDGQWTRAKGFDTFCPIGPAIETSLDPSNVAISSWLNGEKKQESRTSNLIFGVPALIEFISGVMTLLPGDVIATGTPSGIGPMLPGDEIEIRIEGIGSLINPVTG